MNSNKKSHINEEVFTKELIPGSAFAYSKIQELIFPQTSKVRVLGKFAFSSCLNLKLVAINGTVEEIGENCFLSCKNLSKFQIVGESHLKIIKEQAFSGTRIVSFLFPPSLEKIGNYVFEYVNNYDLSNTKMEEFKLICEHYTYDNVLLLPNTIKRLKIHKMFKIARVADGGKFFINGGSFLYSKIEPTIYFANKEKKKLFIRRGIEKINCFAFFNTKMKVISFPASLKEICRQAFDSCSNLERIVFENPSALNKIGEYAFAYCNKIKRVDFPPSLVELGDYAFYCCESLCRVTFPPDSRLKLIGESAFNSTKAKQRIKLPTNVRKVSSNQVYIDYKGLIRKF